MLHHTFEKFLKKYKDADLTREECYQKASEIFDERLPNVHFGAMLATDRQKAFNNILKNIACEASWKIKKHISDCRVIGEEIAFGYGKYPPIEIQTDSGTVYIEGKIDRADVLTKDNQLYLRIVDYKSGNITFSEAQLSSGKNLQLLIYMSALLKHFKNYKPASAQYMSVIDNTFSGPEILDFNEKGITKEHFDHLLDTAESVSQDLVKNILSGNIKAQSLKNDDSCKYCKFSSICGIKHKEDANDANVD